MDLPDRNPSNKCSNIKFWTMCLLPGLVARPLMTVATIMVCAEINKKTGHDNSHRNYHHLSKKGIVLADLQDTLYIVGSLGGALLLNLALSCLQYRLYINYILNKTVQTKPLRVSVNNGGDESAPLLSPGMDQFVVKMRAKLRGTMVPCASWFSCGRHLLGMGLGILAGMAVVGGMMAAGKHDYVEDIGVHVTEHLLVGLVVAQSVDAGVQLAAFALGWGLKAYCPSKFSSTRNYGRLNEPDASNPREQMNNVAAGDGEDFADERANTTAPSFGASFAGTDAAV